MRSSRTLRSSLIRIRSQILFFHLSLSAHDHSIIPRLHLSNMKMSIGLRFYSKIAASAKTLTIQASAMAIPRITGQARRAEVRYESAVKGKIGKDFGHVGEDAYFIARPNENLLALGVADGVFQWAEYGVDSGEFSRALMALSKQYLMSHIKSPVNVEQAQEALAHAYEHNVTNKIRGSTTACLLLVDGSTQQLVGTNLGDSGFVVFRGSNLQPVFKSREQTHSFGWPYQLGLDLQYQPLKIRPSDAETMQLEIQRGDVILAASDGLWNNVSLEEASELLRQCQTPVDMSRRLSLLAFEHSRDRHRDTPFSRAALEEYNMPYSGGKIDDITIIIAKVQ